MVDFYNEKEHDVTADAKKVLIVDSTGSAVPIATLQQKDYTGADCTGASGATNRTLTINNTATSFKESVYLSGVLQTAGTHYTISHLSASSVITFLVAVLDAHEIAVHYYV